MLFDRLVRLLRPRENVFFTLLEGIASRIEVAAAAFGELADAADLEQIQAIAVRLKAIETDADGICRQLYAQVDRTFFTPIDREDLVALAKALDDVIDGMEHTAAFAFLYRFDRLTDPMRQLVRITVRAADGVARAVNLLRRYEDSEKNLGPTEAVHALENEADAVYRAAIAALFADVLPADLVRQKDMLFSLEQGVDQCEDAMDVIRSVVVKNG
jgi:predicted phosphate transport protein (TIGR00153 family)